MLVVVSGCVNGGLREVEELIAQNNYSDALKLFDDSTSFKKEALPLKALVQFVQGQADDGWETLDQAMLSAVNDRAENAQICYRAAVIIAREKSRHREVIALLDSCMVMDPDLQDIAVEVAWSRGMEYMDVRSDAGYWLLRWASAYDRQMVKRLQGRHPKSAERYIEMDETLSQMNRMMTMVQSYYGQFLRYPTDLGRLADYRPNLRQVLTRPGWHFSINSEDGGIVLSATALKKHPASVFAGTVLKVNG